MRRFFVITVNLPKVCAENYAIESTWAVRSAFEEKASVAVGCQEQEIDRKLYFDFRVEPQTEGSPFQPRRGVPTLKP